MWYASRYADILALLRDRRLGRTIDHLRPPEPTPDYLKPFHRLDQHFLFNKEPPDHTRLRSLVSSVFTPPRVESLRPRIQQAANQLLDQALSRLTFDLLADYAVPRPVAVIADQLDLTRLNNPHLSSGAGIHSCLGAPLAPLELNLTLATLLRHAPDLELANEPEWRESYEIRSLKALLVSQPPRID